MTFEEFKEQVQLGLKASGLEVSKRDTDQILRVFTNELDSLRKKGGFLRIPKFGTLKVVSKPAKEGVMIAGRKLNIKARQRFVFKPLESTLRP